MGQFYNTPEVSAPVGTSDHACVSMMPKGDTCRPKKEFVYARKINSTTKAALGLCMAMEDWNHVLSAEGIENKTEALNTTITTMLDTCMPKRRKRVRTTDKPWMTEKVKSIIQNRQEHFHKHGRTKKWKILRNQAQKLVKQAKDSYYTRHIQQLKNENPRKWWDFVNTELGRKQKGSNHVRIDGVSEEDVATELNNFFAESWCESNSLSILPLPRLKYNKELCSVGEVKLLLKNINGRKATGPDGIPSWLLKEHAEDLAPVITHLFNQSFTEGKLPSFWKSANVVPIPKEPGANQLNQFRPISLISVIAKLLEKCMLKRTSDHILSVVKDQFAYQKKSSTTIALVKAYQSWLTALDSREGTVIRVLLADMSKAFDRVNHATLMLRFCEVISDPRDIAWTLDYLHGRTQRVFANNTYSQWTHITSGVPQGVLEYGHVLLVGCSKGQEEELERVQRRALKIISRRGIRAAPPPSISKGTKGGSCNHPAETNDESIPPTS
ncbi:hypothetical protein SKAU_G00020750 [Synaphobranchus kaupii]|uniref:Reverse transcriptase domain-containing protein n=1 Tax=Synaphobranchus kaupii TaxID=118154 RepID=A0A9Q1JEC5_SYNKA|nr:hypothetical protein SKAU_G00020750 [Synaphobranchus kaupii]